jgi:hypothetical protein
MSPRAGHRDLHGSSQRRLCAARPKLRASLSPFVNAWCDVGVSRYDSLLLSWQTARSETPSRLAPDERRDPRVPSRTPVVLRVDRERKH